VRIFLERKDVNPDTANEQCSQRQPSQSSDDASPRPGRGDAKVVRRPSTAVRLQPLVGRSGTTTSLLIFLNLFPFPFSFLTLTYLSTSICLIDQFCASVVDGRPPCLGRRQGSPSRPLSSSPHLGRTGRLNSLPNGAVRPSGARTRTDDFLSSRPVLQPNCPGIQSEGRRASQSPAGMLSR